MFIRSPSHVLRSSRPGLTHHDGKTPPLSRGMAQLLAAVFGVALPPPSAPSNISPFFRALETGIRQTYPAPLGGLLARAVAYCHRRTLDRTQLQKLVDMDSGAVLIALFGNHADGTTMRLIGEAMVGSALLGDHHGVCQWAQQGLNRCARVGGDWAATASDWQWVAANTSEYMLRIQELRHFLVPA